MVVGTLFIIAAPSGAGKTSLVNALVTERDNIMVSVSHTTRAMRPGEREGVDYHFVTPQRFKSMVEQGAFLEHATVFDYSYGTSRRRVMDQLAEGVDVILEIDWQGAQQIRELVDECVSIFILPPSKAALLERLRSRRQDSYEVIARRMRDAVKELSHYEEFNYLIVNDDFHHALAELNMLIASERLRATKRKEQLADLIDDLLSETAALDNGM